MRFSISSPLKISLSCATDSWSSFSPTVGYASGGQNLTFTGTGFTLGSSGNYKCRFTAGTQSVDSTTPIMVTSQTSLVCLTPYWSFNIPGDKKVAVSLLSGSRVVTDSMRSATFYLAGAHHHANACRRTLSDCTLDCRICLASSDHGLLLKMMPV